MPQLPYNATCVSEISRQKDNRCSVSVLILEDLKQLENINNTAFNDVSSEQSCTVTNIKRKWFNMTLDAKKRLVKVKRSMTNIRSGQGVT